MEGPEAVNIELPLSEVVRAIVAEAVAVAWREHMVACPAAEIERRLTRIERMLIAGLAFLGGSGILGLGGYELSRLFGG
jgi:hypothetical protein